MDIILKTLMLELLSILNKKREIRQRRQPLLLHGKQLTSQQTVSQDHHAQRQRNAQTLLIAAVLPNQRSPVKKISKVSVLIN